MEIWIFKKTNIDRDIEEKCIKIDWPKSSEIESLMKIKRDKQIEEMF